MRTSKVQDVGASASDEEPPSSAEASGDHSSSCQNLQIELSRDSRWTDWRWQIRNRIRGVSQLLSRFPTLQGLDHIEQVAGKYPMAITPYYASLIRSADSADPVYLMSVPQIQEFHNPPFLCEDPLEENEDMPVAGLVHRYPDRALLIATTTCSMYCRHCTRKRVAGTREASISAVRLQQVVRYLTAHPEISDVIVSGGDPFTMTDEALERVLQALRSVASVDIIRIGTRVPVVMPMRITDELARMLRKYQPLYVNTHFNHPNELTPEAAAACGRLVDAGVPMGNQSVLLRGVNDDPKIMEQLCRGLVRMRVRPYYLFQCDLVAGVEHFRTPLSRGIEIMEYLRGRLSGLAIPTFVVDAPHGGGKIPLLPNYIVSVSPTHTVLRNFEGLIVNYPEPAPTAYPQATAGSGGASSVGVGVWELASGQASAIVPADLKRTQRRHQNDAELSGAAKPLL